MGAARFPKVGDVMAKDVVCLDADESIESACKTMAERKIGSVVVTVEGKPAGIFTERDLLTKVYLKGVDMKSAKLRDFMSAPLITIRPNVSVREAARIMRQMKVRRLPVLDEQGKLVGIFTSADLATAIAEYTMEV